MASIFLSTAGNQLNIVETVLEYLFSLWDGKFQSFAMHPLLVLVLVVGITAENQVVVIVTYCFQADVLIVFLDIYVAVKFF